MNYTFVFNLETGNIEKEPEIGYSIVYVDINSEKMVEIGDRYRHERVIKGEYWNRILRMIKDNELDNKGIEAIIRGLMSDVLPEKYCGNFISSVKLGIIKEI